MRRGADVPEPIVERLRAICAELPESREEAAWTGARWRVGTNTFAHLVAIVDGWPPAYARSAGADGPAVVLTVQSSGEELQALGNMGHPYFRPPWRPGIVGMFVDDDGTDWDEVGELVTESYCLVAPQRLVAQVARPPHA
jgi:predicted DNA-binding protein (MmcQ/YjbR family)